MRKNLKLFENKYFFLLCAFIAIVFSINNTQVDNQELKEASFYTRLTNNKVQCLLCPRKCVLNQNKRGFCNVRVNKLGRLYSLVYGKPFLSILPTPMWSLIYSGLDKNLLQIGTIGCNMRCKFCLSWEISQALPNECPFIKDSICAANSFEPPVNNKLLSPEEVLLFAKKNNLKIICYTLNEPTVSFEYTLDLAKLAKKEGFINILSTNGYINKEPLGLLMEYMDGVSLGLKGFNDRVYREYCSAEFKPILETLKFIKERGANFEITYPVIPTVNDNPEEVRRMCNWIKENLGPEAPLHFYRYRPSFLLQGLPYTSPIVLETLRKVALREGLKNIYVCYHGDDLRWLEEEIYCSNCKKLLLSRKQGRILTNNINRGKCKFCGHKALFIISDNLVQK